MYDLKVAYHPGEGLGAAGSPEGSEGLQGSLTLLTLAHGVLDLRYPMLVQEGGDGWKKLKSWMMICAWLREITAEPR